MAWVSIDGVAVRVLGSGAEVREPVLIGERVRAWAGNLRSTVRAEKRQWGLVALCVNAGEADVLRALADDQTVRALTGDAFGGATISVLVRVEQEEPQDEAVRLLTLVAEEQ